MWFQKNDFDVVERELRKAAERWENLSPEQHEAIRQERADQEHRRADDLARQRQREYQGRSE